MGKYDQIINMERPFDPNHPPMSMHNRAAQFAPFDALTGLSGKLYETSRQVGQRIELSEEEQHDIDLSLQQLKENIAKQPIVTLSYFVPDKIKDGGSYQTITASVLKIDLYRKCLVFEDGTRIAFCDISSLEFNESDW